MADRLKGEGLADRLEGEGLASFMNVNALYILIGCLLTSQPKTTQSIEFGNLIVVVGCCCFPPENMVLRVRGCVRMSVCVCSCVCVCVCVCVHALVFSRIPPSYADLYCNPNRSPRRTSVPSKEQSPLPPRSHALSLFLTLTLTLALALILTDTCFQTDACTYASLTRNRLFHTFTETGR